LVRKSPSRKTATTETEIVRDWLIGAEQQCSTPVSR